jgi:hypothetical protein
VTGKTGEILKKRTFDRNTLSERWRRIAQQNESNVIAIVRQKGNILKFLNEDAWQAYVDGMQFADDSVVSLHCFVKSKRHTIYRNTYELKDQTGRALTTTTSYAYQIDEADPESITIFHEDSAKFYECIASNITSIMDLATKTIVRYIEIMLAVKVISLKVDYVIDPKSQLWMLWTSDARFVHGNLLAEIPGLPSGDRAGRMSWAGPKYFEAKLDGEDHMDTKSYDTGPSRPNSRLGSASSWSKEDSYKADPSLASTQLQMASLTLDTAVIQAQNASAEAAGLKRKKGSNTLPLSSPRNLYSTDPNPSRPIQGSFPDPFKCRGDYCHMSVKAVGSLTQSDQVTRDHGIEKLFSQKELNVMRKNPNYGRMMDFSAANGPALAAITQRSILLARKERRGMSSDKAENLEDWRAYPTTPRQNSAELLRADLESVSNNKSQAERDMIARSALADKELRAEQVQETFCYFIFSQG